jgi:hypothetical protein
MKHRDADDRRPDRERKPAHRGPQLAVRGSGRWWILGLIGLGLLFSALASAAAARRIGAENPVGGEPVTEEPVVAQVPAIVRPPALSGPPALAGSSIAPRESESATAPSAEYDLVIRGGRIVDGTGEAAYVGDVAISGGRLVALGQVVGRGTQEIPAAGWVVAPGFIDMMGQSATELLNGPSAALNLLSQGITTINCGEGSSAAPLGSDQEPRRGWTTMREYLALLDMQGLPLNVVQTVGHTQVRGLVLGDQDRRPGPAELQAMEALVE